MAHKNKQFKIEKGLMLFTQPKSPFFYGKIRINGKYKTKSFAPILEFSQAKKKLYDWREELINSNLANNSYKKENNDRNEYVAFKKLDNNFQFLDVGRFDPVKKLPNERLN